MAATWQRSGRVDSSISFCALVRDTPDMSSLIRGPALLGLTFGLASLACSPDPGSDDAGTETNASDTQGDTQGETHGEMCVWPQDDTPAGTEATITIRNESAAVAYVLPKSPFSCDYTKFQIDIEGEPVRWDHPNIYPVECGPGACGWGCSDGGDQGLIINPGASVDLSWNGALWRSEELSEACVAEIECVNTVSSCEVRQAYESVEYTVRVQLAESCPGVEGECAACDAGVCEIFVYEPQAFETWKSFEASATFPEGVEVVITD